MNAIVVIIVGVNDRSCIILYSLRGHKERKIDEIIFYTFIFFILLTSKSVSIIIPIKGRNCLSLRP